MIHDHNQDTIMRDALVLLSEKRDIEFIGSILERLEKYATAFKKNQDPGKQDLIDLEYDLIVYSRLLPFKLIQSYPQVDVMAFNKILDSYKDFASLLADTVNYYDTDDTTLLPAKIRKHFEN